MPDAAPLPRLYDDLARLWPHLSPPEHYAPEAAAVDSALIEHLGEPMPGTTWRILELGAGGGHTIHHLQDAYDCTAVDLSEPMLKNCRALNPLVRCIQGDMRDVRLHETFDAVLIHDAIDYMLTEEDVLATLRTAAEHLRPGGVALIAPTYVRETFVDGDVADDGTTIPGIGNPRNESGGVASGADELTYFTFVHDPDPADSVFEMILLYLIRDGKTRQVEVVEDRHTCGLFAAEHWLAMMDEAGLTPQPVSPPPPEGPEDGREAAAWTLFVGKREGVERQPLPPDRRRPNGHHPKPGQSAAPGPGCSTNSVWQPVPGPALRSGPACLPRYPSVGVLPTSRFPPPETRHPKPESRSTP